MPIAIAISEDSAPLMVQDEVALHAALRQAEDSANACGRLGVITLTASNGNEMTLVVGGPETALGFVHDHCDPPYYASAGQSDAEEPVLTAYYLLGHHTEFPRYSVITMALGAKAAEQFLATSDLPSCVQWREA
ncbi:MAG TPA: Imm1 family immunity protein [Lysobacter sp.]